MVVLTQPSCPQVFSLPKVSAKTKFKLTAHEGCRVRRVALVALSSAVQEDYSEHALVCLTNLGDMHLFNVPALRPQVRGGLTLTLFTDYFICRQNIFKYLKE